MPETADNNKREQKKNHNGKAWCIRMNITADNLLTTVMNNDYSYPYTRTKTVSKIDSEVRELRDETKQFKKAVKRLTDCNDNTITKEMMEKRLEKFTEEYNTLLKDASKISDSTYKKNLDKLKNLVEENKYKLKKVGFSYSSDDEKYVFDAEKFQKATKAEIASVMSGDGSFMKEAGKLTQKMYRAASSKVNVSQRVTQTEKMSLTQEQVLAGYAAANTITVMSNLKTSISNGIIDSTFSDEINANLATYAAQCNAFLLCNSDGEEAECINQFLALNDDNIDKLNDIGFNIVLNSSNAVEMQYTEKDWTSADETSLNALKSLFGIATDGSENFGMQAEKICKNIFSAAMKLGTSGVIVDEYV